MSLYKNSLKVLDYSPEGPWFEIRRSFKIKKIKSNIVLSNNSPLLKKYALKMHDYYVRVLDVSLYKYSFKALDYSLNVLDLRSVDNSKYKKIGKYSPE